MKYLPLMGLLLILGIAGSAWWFMQSRIDATGKIHTDLYEEAKGVWDPKMEVVPFERLPSEMLTLHWDPPTKSYNHFVVSISTADGSLLRRESGEHDRVSLDVDGLIPQTEYVFALQACLDPRCTTWYISQNDSRGTTQGGVDTSAAIE
jgi:hypothetical protein